MKSILYFVIFFTVQVILIFTILFVTVKVKNTFDNIKDNKCIVSYKQCIILKSKMECKTLLSSCYSI